MLVTQQHKGKQSHMSQSEGQVAVVAKCSRQSQTEVIFVAMDALVERIYVEDLIAKKMRLPCRIPACFI